MSKQQIVLFSVLGVLFVFIYFFARKKPLLHDSNPMPAMQALSGGHQDINYVDSSILVLQPIWKTRAKGMQQKLQEAQNSSDKLKIYHELISFWKDSAKNSVVAFFYMGEKAKLENSEKNLNFAANSLLNHLMVEHDVEKQHWMAKQAKLFFESSLAINPENDSAQVGIGATYIFGNIGENPMQGIQKIIAVTQKDSTNMYAQLMLGLGGMKSGQFENATRRFLKVIEKEPDNLMVIFSLAECYENLSDKSNAIKWYQVARKKVGIEQAKKEIDARIEELKMR